MSYFLNKRCLVTGAAGGIGKAVALALAKEGAELAITDINAEQLQQTADEIQQLGAKLLLANAADITDFTTIVQMAESLHSGYGSMDMLFNVAGISTWGSIENLEIEHWRQLIDVNLMGPVHVLKAFTPTMIAEKRGGHIINVSSAAGLFGLPWHSAYSATKFGLRGLSEVLRFDLKSSNIHVSLVCPGAVDTGLVRTINIVGVDMNNPKVKALTSRFQKHAVSPESAAKSILKGVRRKQYMVYTSFDIAFGHWFTTKWAWPYQLVMTLLNRLLTKTLASINKAD